jgi:hypothetical protein
MILGLFVGMTYSCSVSTDKQIEKLNLPDTFFVLKNYHNSDLLAKVKYINNRLFLDSTKQIEFVALDTNYKVKILAPVLKEDLGVDENYVKSFLISYFISKQDKIGNFQPVIIWISGDDYNSLIMVLLDSALNPISHILLNGGFYAGPYEVNDSLTSWGEEKNSRIDGNKIESYCLNTYVWTDSRNDLTFIDSLSYKSIILENGLIQTEKVDSIRIVKRIKN